MTYRSVFREGLFAGKVVIVTGGGSGLGRCTAHELASLGATVALLGRNAEKLELVRAEIEEDGGMATAHVCDIRDESAVSATVDSVLSSCGKIDGLVNNAGGQYRSRLAQITTKGFEAVVRNNLTGTFIISREVYNRSMQNHGGSIVNIIADIWHGWPIYGHSGAARAGVLNITETAACEWASSGVRVNAVAPGVFASSGLDTYPPDVKPAILKRPLKIPLQRFGTESEISAAIVFLLSPAASFITGACLRVDGGAPNVRQDWELEAHAKSQPFEGFHRSVRPGLLGDSS
ncbi:citronellol/citronellal dehydrogenase [Bradyrhizobium macuxiense]|uniref:Peroxisomal trans-2-enoyl-CoA reductase n=1 Tax=Bradyrhizobium macuxiense TaxID=1755647 RepID=A0A560KX10_9BRAD|nr:SDR family oxidoreductase [Bradyrhizobium macuxiense]TWB87778.1 citronellol/citronellal dehydrogenase [Bradyrhizobium macuxiense]